MVVHRHVHAMLSRRYLCCSSAHAQVLHGVYDLQIRQQACVVLAIATRERSAAPKTFSERWRIGADCTAAIARMRVLARQGTDSLPAAIKAGILHCVRFRAHVRRLCLAVT